MEKLSKILAFFLVVSLLLSFTGCVTGKESGKVAVEENETNTFDETDSATENPDEGGQDESMLLTREAAQEILWLYDHYCSLGVCNGAGEMCDEATAKEVLSYAGFPEDAILYYLVRPVSCCATVAEARAHVAEYVDEAFLPDRTEYVDHPVEYNGVLYELVPGKGSNGHQIIKELSVQQTEATFALCDYIFGNKFIGTFRLLDGKWKLVGIQQMPNSWTGWEDYSEVYVELKTQLESDGFDNIVLKKVDIAEAAGDELLCLCQREGCWYLIICIINGPNMEYSWIIDLSKEACYLTEYEGKTYLLRYRQNIIEVDGRIYTDYGFALIYLDRNGNEQVVDQATAGYYNDESDGSQAAAFFQSLNKYLLKVIVVICDPYCLTGQQWLDQSQADFGQPPQPEQLPEEEENSAVIGFVQINDPGSWLNLREGPGLDYECIRLYPEDPSSIVKQAKGSPVTVLEEVETPNGAWLKISIQYHDRQIVGYSYKEYIRLAGE